MAKKLQTKTVKIDTIRQDKKNARSHDDRNIAAIAASLSRFGQQKPIVVDTRGRIVAGSGTHAAAIQLGWDKITIVQTDLKGKEASAYAIADNRSAELATWNDGILTTLLQTLRAEDAGLLDASGYTSQELDILIDEQSAGLPSNIDAAGAALGEARTKPGQLIRLGEHLLLCGDSASKKDIAKLLDGQLVHLVNTDPPYNVAIEPRTKTAIAKGRSSHQAKGKKGKAKKERPRDRPIANDNAATEAEYRELLTAWFGNIAQVLAPGRSFYIWGGYANCGNYPPEMDAAGLHFAQSIIWVKQHPVMNRKDFMGNHEWAFYGWRRGAAHYFNPRLRNIPDVWEVKHADATETPDLGKDATPLFCEAMAEAPNGTKVEVTVNIEGLGRVTIERTRKHRAPDVWIVKKVAPTKMVHLTEKPAELAARAMKYSSRRGENVLDLFGGSGSTLVAAESMERRAFVMEIDPHYCDVIVDRWETLTGGKAKRR